MHASNQRDSQSMLQHAHMCNAQHIQKLREDRTEMKRPGRSQSSVASGRGWPRRGEPGAATTARASPCALELDGGCDNGDGGKTRAAGAPRWPRPARAASEFKMAAAEAGLASGLGLRLEESEGDRRLRAGVT